MEFTARAIKQGRPVIINRPTFMLLGLAAAMALSGCNAVNEQMAYRDQQRRSCAAVGGYFEDNKIGSPDNYTCKGLPAGQTAAAAPPPTNCRTDTATVKHDDGTVETNTNQICTSF
jgi:hypothetical protein